MIDNNKFLEFENLRSKYKLCLKNALIKNG